MDKKQSNKKYVGVNFKAPEYERIKALAERENRSVSNMVKTCMLEFLKAFEEKEHAHTAG